MNQYEYICLPITDNRGGLAIREFERIPDGPWPIWAAASLQCKTIFKLSKNGPFEKRFPSLFTIL